MIDVILVLIILAIVGAACGYLIKAKKRGIRCVGCPDSGTCAGSCGSSGEDSCKCGGK